MEIEFRDDKLALVESDPARVARDTRLPAEVVERLRDKIVFIRAAPDERSLRNWKSLHYEKLEGRGDERSIRLNKQWRLILTVDTKQHPNKATILKVEDYH